MNSFITQRNSNGIYFLTKTGFLKLNYWSSVLLTNIMDVFTLQIFSNN